MINQDNLLPFSQNELHSLEAISQEAIHCDIFHANKSTVKNLIAGFEYRAIFYVENPFFYPSKDSSLSGVFISVNFYKSTLRDGSIDRVEFCGSSINKTSNSIRDIHDGAPYMDDFSTPDIKYNECFNIDDNDLETFLTDSSHLKKMFDKFLPRLKSIVSIVSDKSQD